MHLQNPTPNFVRAGCSRPLRCPSRCFTTRSRTHDAERGALRRSSFHWRLLACIADFHTLFSFSPFSFQLCISLYYWFHSCRFLYLLLSAFICFISAFIPYIPHLIYSLLLIVRRKFHSTSKINAGTKFGHLSVLIKGLKNLSKGLFGAITYLISRNAIDCVEGEIWPGPVSRIY